MDGTAAGLANVGGNVVVPITYIDVYKALTEQDLPEGIALSLLAILGEGMQTYNVEEKMEQTRKQRLDATNPLGFETVKELMK
jgi:hypothetical protein